MSTARVSGAVTILCAQRHDARTRAITSPALDRCAVRGYRCGPIGGVGAAVMNRAVRFEVCALATLVVIVTSIVASIGGSTATAEEECGVGSLSGIYTTTNSGTVGGVPSTGVGTVTFDGAGHVSGSQVDSTEGAISRTPIEGTYDVTADCRGTAVFEHRHEQKVGDSWAEHLVETHVIEMAVAADGRKVYWILAESSPPEPVRSTIATPRQPNLGIMFSGTFDRS